MSVRENKPDFSQPVPVGGGFAGTTSSLNLTNFNVDNLLGIAYGASWHQLQNVPAWGQTTMYMVQARADEAADAKLATLSKEQRQLEQQHMMQGLLADRFHLKAHWESHEAPAYDLVVSKGGSRLHPGGSVPPSPQEKSSFGDRPMPEIHQSGNGQRGYEFLGHSCHIQALTRSLSLITGTEVADKTGLTGTYDFDLQYSQASDEQRQADPALWPDVQQAVQEQLGLKLQRSKGMARVLVIDHVEPPTPN